MELLAWRGTCVKSQVRGDFFFFFGCMRCVELLTWQLRWLDIFGVFPGT